MKRALLVSHLSTHFIELARVARAMKASGRWEPAFHFARPYPESGANAATCTAEGWAFTSAAPLPPPPAPAAGAMAAPPAPLSASTLAFRRLPGPAKQLARWMWLYPKRRRTDRRMIAAATEALRGSSLLVLAEDNVDYRTATFVRAAKDLGLGSVVVPFTVANALEPAEAYWDSEPRNVRGLDHLFARRHPRWVFEHRGKKLLRIPAAEALAVEHMGLAPPQPWILNSGHADRIAVESDAMLAHYRNHGIPEAQLTVTGAVYDDTVAQAIRDAAATRRELALDERPVLLCALPPDQIAGREDRVDFRSHEELARFWAGVLTENRRFQLVVNLHPRTPPASMAFLESLGAKIARTDVARLIPICDLFVASVSATIRMAIACGKPVINYDVYRYRYTDYRGVAGVLTLEDRGGFAGAVRRLTGDPAALAAATDAQKAIATVWGRLDGKSAERMLALFDELSAKGPSA